MFITPNSAVRLLAVPLNKNQKNQIDFTSAAEQYNYFASKSIAGYTSCTYVRKEERLRVDLNIEQLWGIVNYCMYQNTNYGDKWFYAFIERMEYINESMTAVYIKTDVYQTWIFNVNLLPSFVVREHVTDDSIGANLIEENLDTGEYVIQATEYSEDLGDDIIVVGSTVPLGGSLGSPSVSGYMYSGVFSGVLYYRFRKTTEDINTLKEYLQAVCDNGQADSIVCMFMFKNGFFDSDVWTVDLPEQQQMDKYIGIQARISFVDGYRPKNNKLLTYPYNFLYATNQQGQSAVYKYEYTNQHSGLYEFRLYCNIAPNAVIYLVPQYYKGGGNCIDECLTLSGFPQCSWNIDAYKNWLAQNSTGLILSAVGSGISIVAGAATGNAIAVGYGAVSIGQELAELYKHSIEPPQARGSAAGAGGAAYANGFFDFMFQHKCIQEQYARRIDNYFEMFGYKVNALKTPQIRTRPKWNYLQTIDVNILGSIPENDMDELKGLFNNGITFWHDPSHFCDYSQNNH